jgi:hypothetical protein
VPLRAALEHVPPLPRPGPEDPGPFSFASEQRVHRILADAGFQSVIEPCDFDLDIACGGGIEEALEAAMALGPTSRALQDQGPETRAAVATSICRALQPYQRGRQVALARGNLARHREQRLARGAGPSSFLEIIAEGRITIAHRGPRDVAGWSMVASRRGGQSNARPMPAGRI